MISEAFAFSGQTQNRLKWIRILKGITLVFIPLSTLEGKHSMKSLSDSWLTAAQQTRNFNGSEKAEMYSTKIVRKVKEGYTLSKARSITVPGEQKYPSNPNINLITSGPQ